MSDETPRLFGLGGVEAVGVEAADDDIPMPALVTCDEQDRCCPGCGVGPERPHSRCATTRRACGHLTAHTSGRHAQPRCSLR